MAESKSSEQSPGGSSIERHQARERPWQPPAESTGMKEIEQHFTRFWGEPETVFHELVSDLVHIDVHLVPPRAERNCWTLFTTGMSDLPMTTPAAAEGLRFAELVLALPADWNLRALKVMPPPADLERWYWPVRWLKQLARLPHDYKTWLGFGHTIPSADPPEPFHADTKLCGWFLLPPITVPESARSVKLADGRVVHLYCLHALHADEMDLKLAKGTNALLGAFDRAHVSEVLDLERPSSIRRKRFGIF